MTHKETIAQLKKELEKYTEKDNKRLGIVKDQKEIADLKKKIREKKYAGVKQAGRNLKVIGKNIVIVSKAIGKGMGEFIGEEPKKKDGSQKYNIDDLLKKLPQ